MGAGLGPANRQLAQCRAKIQQLRAEEIYTDTISVVIEMDGSPRRIAGNSAYRAWTSAAQLVRQGLPGEWVGGRSDEGWGSWFPHSAGSGNFYQPGGRGAANKHENNLPAS